MPGLGMKNHNISIFWVKAIPLVMPMPVGCIAVDLVAVP